MVARSISSPGSNTVNWLRATAGGALLVVVAVWTAMTVVSSVLAVLVVSAAKVPVICTVVVARSVSSPGSKTVHWLGATAGGASVLTI